MDDTEVSESGYARRRNALISHLASRHGLVGYDPFPLGTGHAYPTDSRGNVIVHNHDLGWLLSLHDREGTHGLPTHQHESPAEQERRGQYVSPEKWRPDFPVANPLAASAPGTGVPPRQPAVLASRPQAADRRRPAR
jgi:hypothetical protein